MRAATALALSIIATAPAFGADFPVLRGSFAPAASPRAASDDQTQWEGFYIGGLYAYGGGRFRNMSATPNDLLGNFYNGVSAGSVPASYRQFPTYAIALGTDRKSGYGGFVGYNMVYGDAVLGLEADATRMAITATGSHTYVTPDINGVGVGYSAMTGASRASLDGYATLRARAGWASGMFMPFITGGLAVGKGSYSNTLTLAYSATAGAPPAADNVVSQTIKKNDAYFLGGALGLGVDMLLAQNILLRAEYQMVRFFGSNVPVELHTARAGVGVKF